MEYKINIKSRIIHCTTSHYGLWRIHRFSGQQLIKPLKTNTKLNSRIREIKEGYWESFTADMEHDIYGAQKKVWKLIRRTKKEVNKFVTNNKITIDEWEIFFRELYRGTSSDVGNILAIN